MLSGDTLPFAVGLTYDIVISASFGQIEIISSPAPENKTIPMNIEIIGYRVIQDGYIAILRNFAKDY